jgi:hypothetical protein
MTLPISNVITIRNDLLTLLTNNVTTLNVNLTKTITNTNKQIKKGNPGLLTTVSTGYPYVFVDYLSKEEEFVTLGAGGRKNVILNYAIYALTKNMRSRTDDDDESIQLSDNIDKVLRNNIAFSSEILWSNPVSADAKIFESDSTYIAGVETTLQCAVKVIGS